VKEARVEAVMGAYNRTLGEPCCASGLLLADILRGEWGFDGHVVSDCWALRDIHEHHKVTNTAEESAALAIKAGCDLNCGSVYSSLMDAHDAGLVTDEEIRRAAVRLMTTRFKLGMLGGEGSEFDGIPFDAIDCPEHRALNVRAAEESAVLLKNDGLLPLSVENFARIAVIGPNADSRMALKGNYYGTGAQYITIAEGIRDYCGDRARVYYAEGSKLAAPSSDFISLPNDLLAEAVATAKNCDLTVLVLGLDETIEGEEMMMGSFGNGFEGDKADLSLPECQTELLRAVIATGRPIALILAAGSAIDLREAHAAPNVRAILDAWYPGALGGAAVARLLFGEVSPCGKLPVTFYNSCDDLPAFEDYSMENRTYRYFKGDVLYPFGYGLTYGDVYVETASYDYERKTVIATVRNVGAVSTKDVIQVYIKADSPFAPANPRLCAFVKIPMLPGETRILRIPLPDDAFTVVNDDGERIPARYCTLHVGTNQPGARAAELTGRESVRVSV
jgi:beta-glucosidase